ncbi:MAG: amidohydrolase family protein [Chloroflexota bacterium]
MAENRQLSVHAPRFRPPPGACDTHIHVFGPAAAYPYSPARTYTPGDALPAQAAAMLLALGMDRVVLVQPSVYGADNRRLTDALDELGPRARGVAVIDVGGAAAEMACLSARGIKGARLNAAASARGDARSFARDLDTLCARVAPEGWHVQVHVGPHLLPVLEARAASLPVDVVIDHFGMVPVTANQHLWALDSLRRLLATGKIWIKLSAPYRVCGSDTDFARVAELARGLIVTNPERVLWGSDWPHTPPHGRAMDRAATTAPFRRVSTGATLDALAQWTDNPPTRDQILVHNPARLYGFTAADLPAVQ